MDIIESKLNFGKLETRKKTTYIILHHAAHSNCTVQDIHKWHINKLWSGIGYHFFITKDGIIYRGRPENAVGAHCKGYNYNSIGICVQGNYMNDIMPKIQSNAVSNLCKMLSQKYKIKKIYLHRELSKTNCPGINFKVY